MPVRVVVAPDSFKGTFPAWEVADAIAEGVESAGGVAERCPVADGGEGTARILVEATAGRLETVPATDPLGRPLQAQIGLSGTEAFVEVAEASGLSLLAERERDPELASTFGTGQLILAARDHGAERILVAAGGSATVDGGAGAIEAITDGGGIGAASLAVLCDVDTPFEQAAAVFGPQKGASPDAVERLAAKLARIAAELPLDPRGRPMTGAAGGLSGGLWSALGAELIPGAEFVLDTLEFDRRLRGADLAIVGEGSLDRQSFAGKIVGRVAARCRLAAVPVHAIVGSNQLSVAESRELGLTEVRVASKRRELVEAGRQLVSELTEIIPR